MGWLLFTGVFSEIGGVFSENVGVYRGYRNSGNETIDLIAESAASPTPKTYIMFLFLYRLVRIGPMPWSTPGEGFPIWDTASVKTSLIIKL